MALGLPINFGFATTSGGMTSATLSGKFILQSADVSLESDEEQVRDAVGALAVRNFYNGSKKATIEYVVTGTTAANAQANSVPPAVGSFVVISACASMPDLVSSYWVVATGPKVALSNTTSCKITLNLELHAGITAAAT